MSELQTDSGNSGITLDNDHVETNETGTEESGTINESGAELATATEDKQDKSEDGDIEARTRKAINKQHAKYREEERKRIKAEDKAKELEDKLTAIESAKVETDIPPLPDPYDDDFEAKVKARDEAIKRKATEDAQKSIVTQQQNAQEEDAKKADQKRVDNLITNYTSRISTLGLSAEAVRVAGDKVVEYGISSDLAEFILKQEDGPLITQYLSENPIELDNLRNMTVIDGAMRINSDIRNAASSLKPQASTAPDPAETLSGRGAGEQVHPLLKGATFE